MSENIDLDVLKSTRDFIEENCVGPQKGYYLFNTLKKRYESVTAFSYSYFISLFDNNEIITKALVKTQIEKYENNSVVVNNTPKNTIEHINDTNTKVTVEVRKVSENTTSEEQNNDVIKDFTTQPIDNNYYYCTKTIRILKSKLISSILEFFNQENKESLQFGEIYNYIQNKFNVSSVNRQHLAELLKSDKIVLKSVVNEIYLSLPEIKKEKDLIDLNAFFKEKGDKLSVIIKNLGYDAVKSIIGKGLKNFVLFVQAVAEFDENSFEPMELINYENDKLFKAEDIKYILGFFDMFSEEEFLSLLEHKEEISELVNMYAEDEKLKLDKIQFVETIKEMIKNIHPDNLTAKVEYIFPYDVVPYFKNENIKYLNEFGSIPDEHLQILFNHKHIIINFLKVLQQSLPAYLNEKFKLLLQRVNASNIPNSLWEKYVEVLIKRESGLNLEETGQMFGTSRERIRQIERKYLSLFANLFNTKNGFWVRQIRSFAKNNFYLTQEDINRNFSFYPQLFKYLLKKTELPDIVYLDEIDVFYFVDEFDWYKEILMFSEKMPDTVDKTKLMNKIEDLYKFLYKNDVDIPKEFIEKIVLQDYKSSGNYYTKSRISLITKYKQILENYFPNGMYIYSDSDIAKFRTGYKAIFNDDNLAENDRALYGRITAVCYLTGKGHYSLKKDKYISDELSIKIHDYIVNSNRDVFLMNTLFAVFEDDLKNEYIDNKYHLQGILKEMYGDEFFFSRDYISKTKEKTSLYSDIFEYVKQSGRAVSMNEIKQEYPAVPDSVLMMALTAEGIINFWKAYIYADNIKIADYDISTLKNLIDTMLEDGGIHSSNDLLIILDLKHKKLLDNYEIDSQFKLFSIISYIFQGQYEFQRPFFAKLGNKIGYQKERIVEYVRENDEIEISDLFDFVYDNKLHLYSITDFINQDMKGEYVFKDKDTIITLEKSKINKYNTQIAESVLLNAMKNDDFIVSTNFNNYEFLPREVKWTDWLLYSAINNFSTKTKVLLTEGQMRFAKPIFVNADINVNSCDELIEYVKNKLNSDDITLIKYMKNKGLID